MNIQASMAELAGDLNRFDSLADRVEGLIEIQASRYRPNTSDWLVAPWEGDFFLFSEDNEGQRRGREIVFAFLGPSIVCLETLTDSELLERLPGTWKSTGLVKASALRLVGGKMQVDVMVSRLEDMVTALSGRSRHLLAIRPTHSDLLRDFRLALLRKDDESARALLDSIRLHGDVSAENLRYLRIEYLAAFQRWTEMRELPHLRALLQSRRPRAVSENLLRMVWWTELVGFENQSARSAFVDRNVMGTFGPLLRSVWIPSSSEGRIVAFLAAVSDADAIRQDQILSNAADEPERARLRALATAEATATAPTPTEPAADTVMVAFGQGRYSDVIDSFLASPTPDSADFAVQAVLESGVGDAASRVLQEVRDFLSSGRLSLGRRERRDLEDLERLANDSCASWVDWSARIGSDIRWGDAGSVLRNSVGSWQSIGSLDANQIEQVCDALLSAVGGPNDDQLRASLDICCREAVSQLIRGSSSDFSRTILLLLSEQENFSEMVRAAYLDLFKAWLEAGPSRSEYEEVIELTTKIWTRVRSPNAVGWAISILEASTDAPCPSSEVRGNFAAQVINEIRARYHASISLRERAEVEDLAEQLGLPSQPIEASEVERDLWAKLNGKSVGVYSHLPRAKSLLESRLRRLCSIGEVEGNADEAGTPALRAMASRVDYLLVHTWKASHSATQAIDAVRPREEQIFPVQKGVTGFLRALEEALSN